MSILVANVHDSFLILELEVDNESTQRSVPNSFSKRLPTKNSLQLEFRTTSSFLWHKKIIALSNRLKEVFLLVPTEVLSHSATLLCSGLKAARQLTESLPPNKNPFVSLFGTTLCVSLDRVYSKQKSFCKYFSSLLEIPCYCKKKSTFRLFSPKSCEPSVLAPHRDDRTADQFFYTRRDLNSIQVPARRRPVWLRFWPARMVYKSCRRWPMGQNPSLKPFKKDLLIAG